ncbi:MAG: hypothetical protein KKG47_10665 [Proteobacteria bacterium]|nr:hypothetical protein [Pseudomonadota bacterium]MBU1738567.1 hypothetical protein [Pseudomonadota bacterium]
MPTWKKKDEDGQVHFQFLCGPCNAKKKILLERDHWILSRDGEPASCNDCVLQCALTARQLWGAEDRLRYAVCDRCPTLEKCELKGRYYC